MSLGENIRRGRLTLGLTQEALGEKLGVAGQTVSKWERDESLPDAAMLPPLADILGLSLDRMFDRNTARYEDAEASVKNWLLSLGKRERWQGALRLARFIQAVLAGMLERLPPTFVKEWLEVPEGDGGCSAEEGFSLYSSREKLPLFTLFPEPEAGWGPALERDDPAVWEALSSADVRRCLGAIYKHKRYMRMDRGYLDRFFDELGPGDTEKVLSGLEALGVLRRGRTRIDGEETEIFTFCPQVNVLQLLLLGSAGPLGSASFGP
ncbi:MAG: helix-turn-helix transcriptional regulator [Oscillospiraceae bacterium]|nr:helix-turn-helix transcriptional regulator [Oscillospiraceae bacterium]